MIEFLRDGAWQGIAAFITVLGILIGGWFTNHHKGWLYAMLISTLCFGILLINAEFGKRASVEQNLQATVLTLQTQLAQQSVSGNVNLPYVTAITQVVVTTVAAAPAPAITAVTQVAITEIAVTQIAVTEIVATSPPLLVTVTPTSIAPEGSDTPVGTVLSIGQTWYQQGLTMTVGGLEFKDMVCSNRIDWGIWSAVITNNTEQDLVINLDQNDFYLEDDKGSVVDYFILYAHEPCGYSNIGIPGRIATKTIKAGESVKMKIYGVGEIGDRKAYIFGIRDGGRIKNAKWRFDVPR